MQQLNHRVRGLTDNRDLWFIDVFTPMLNASGQPRPELFKSDMLHMNSAGYALWQSLVGPVLDAWAAPQFLPPALNNGQVMLRWTGAGQLESAPTILGSWTPITPAPAPPYSEAADTGTNRFFRLRANP